MFHPKNSRVKAVAVNYRPLIEKLDWLFKGTTYMYIDFANVRPWATKLKFHVDPRRLKQLLDSFSQVKDVKFYQGVLTGDQVSEKEMHNIIDARYVVRTKPVKIMQLSIDTTSLPTMDSPYLLRDFVRKPLLKTLPLQKIQDLNNHLKNLNQQGIKSLEDRKCNFDVEIGVDMLIDAHSRMADTFVLWSGDSDFADPIKKLLQMKRHVVLFGTAGRVSRELNALRDEGLYIFDIRDLKEFVCWSRESSHKSTKDPISGALQL